MTVMLTSLILAILVVAVVIVLLRLAGIDLLAFL